MVPLLTWLIQGAVGPALVGLPVTWTATELAGAAGRWVRRLRRSDGLSRIVRAAAGVDVGLSVDEFAAIRRLLEDESTWVLVGRGTVEDLAVRIGSCLSGRGSEGALAAGRAIAGGLLEFAVRDLEPEWFKQVLFARLERLQADQTSALDLAMAALHADLAALAAQQDLANADRFAQVMSELGRVLSRLPPGPADSGELAVYLAVLSRWLNSDPWPRQRGFSGPALIPAELERKLRVSSAGQDEQDLDADDLGWRCSRLVVLGGPGSGKTWLARRIARLCAEAALVALAAGATPDEVELPLYTTCARLAAAPPAEGIRRAVVASALGQLPDLGGARVLDAVRVLFEEREGPTLLVADSLDEARGADDRIRQADTLPQGWRIVLTSRPGSWEGQLGIGNDDPARQVGELRPLRYPDDVDPFIAAWFDGRPARAADLTAQIRRRPDLQQAATVPLILAFYCIVGGDQPLPGRRADLYPKVIRRMLTGRWRGAGDRDPDPDACMETLRDWAWSAAAANPVSGIGTWADEFPTPRARHHSRDDRDAMDHVAVPLGPADPDSGMTRRRFVHRSMREYLVAEHIAFSMSVAEAAGELLKHLWYDPDWEIAAPAALAMHPKRDQILTDLIGHATGGGQLYADLAAIDGCEEIRGFLARVELESAEDAWSQTSAQIIGQATRDIAMSHLAGGTPAFVVRDWPTSSRLIIRSLLGLLVAETESVVAMELAGTIAGLEPPEADRGQARQVLLGLLATETDPRPAMRLAQAIAGLEPPETDRAQARQVLFGLLTAQTTPWSATDLAEAIAGLDPAEADRAQARQALLGLLAADTTAWEASLLAATIADLEPPEADRTRAWQVLLGLLATETDRQQATDLAQVIAGLEPPEADRARARQVLLSLLTAETNPFQAESLVAAISGLAPPEADRARARQVLLGLLSRETDSEWAARLAEVIAGLEPPEADRARPRQVLLGLLAGETVPGRAQLLAIRVAELAVTAADRAQARRALLGLLAAETVPWRVQGLVEAIARLDPSDADWAQARQEVLGLLAAEESPWQARNLVETIFELDPTAIDRAQARRALLGLLVTQTDQGQAAGLARMIAELEPPEADRAQARQALLGLLATETSPGQAVGLADAIAGLEPSEADREQARQALLGLITAEASPGQVRLLAGAIPMLADTAADWAQARRALLGLLATEGDPGQAAGLAEAIGGLEPAEADRAQARRALLGLLATEGDPGQAAGLAEAIAGLDPSETDRAQMRRALLRLLAGSDPARATGLASTIAELGPSVADLDGFDNLVLPPSPVLLRAMRQNSELHAWLAALPLLSGLGPADPRTG